MSHNYNSFNEDAYGKKFVSLIARIGAMVLNLVCVVINITAILNNTTSSTFASIFGICAGTIAFVCFIISIIREYSK